MKNDRPRSIYDLSRNALITQLAEWKEPAYRADQIRRWMYQRCVTSFDEMTDLSKSLRAQLQASFILGQFLPAADQRSTDGWTRKWLLRGAIGAEIETVLMEYEGNRRTACISSQAGCAMDCSFCATGQMGFLRNLSVGEIVEQVIFVEQQLRSAEPNPARKPIHKDNADTTHALTNIVLMGMGEPFANYNTVMAAVQRLMEPHAQGGFGLGARKITISTVGLVPSILRFAEEDTQVNLAVSLHAATDDLRNRLVPINKTYSLHALSESIRTYIQKTNRRVSLEWALIDGVNDGIEQARALAYFAQQTFDAVREGRNMLHVNLIPLNPTHGYRGRASQQDRIEKFCAVLDAAKIPNTVRVRRGIDIAAGCGQLKAEASKQ